MMSSSRGSPYVDVVVVGAGHAGCEAALAAARAGCTTLVITPNLDRVGYMPCNPSIGGPGKTHLVAEVDALGGEMARAADRAALQVRLLNTSKGPAVQAIRAQEDKILYALAMKESLEHQERLILSQDEVLEVRLKPRGADRPKAVGVTTRAVGQIDAEAVIITAGTFLRGAMIAGESRSSGGRAGDRADVALTGSLAGVGFQLRRLKTGTPPRIDARTVDFETIERQEGSPTPLWMSRDGNAGRIDPLTLPPLDSHRPSPIDEPWRPQLPCFRLGTTLETHEIIRANLHRAPMFNGSIEGIGPRYCPSIEDKVARFSEKPSHPVFLEPEGWRTTELYVQGMSTSLPFDVQDAALRTIHGLQDVRISRYGYAVEYDAIDPSELQTTMESRRVERLFLAGQVNGTSGYEEAAGQGILAGLNAANAVLGRTAVVLGRDQAYIGVMVDDLSSKPYEEPYRMLTSRAEYRLHLRPTTADDRLAKLAYDHGLISGERYREVTQGRELIDLGLAVLEATRFAPSANCNEALNAAGLGSISRPLSALELIRRPGVTIDQVIKAASALGRSIDGNFPESMRIRIEEEIKYGAFVERENREISRRSALEHRPLPPTIDYAAISGLRFEAQLKLNQYKPQTFGQASRLSGVTPADMAVLLIHATRAEALGQ
jgi:tRNA uridine 5-carboxymethylaminomethyl modification enzyme